MTNPFWLLLGPAPSWFEVAWVACLVALIAVTIDLCRHVWRRGH